MKTNIANNIKHYRILLGFTQEQLATKLYLSQKVISNYETGFRTPNIETLCNLADIFDVTLDELVGYEKD